MRTVAIIQARMTSTRLPGKVLLPLAGKPMLARVIERVKRAERIDDLCIAIPDEPTDDPIVDFCRDHGVSDSRGSRDDVLDRYYHAAAMMHADVVIRITSDCPLIDPQVIDVTVQKFFDEQPCDYCSNVLPVRSYPRGLDVEVFSRTALDRIWIEDRDPAWREHVTPYIYRHPEWFRMASQRNDVDQSSLRWTVDTPDDLEFARRVFSHFGDRPFLWTDVLDVLKSHPEWTAINAHIEQKVVH